MTRPLPEDGSLLPNRCLTPIFVGVLVEDFVGARHAELVAGALLDRVGALLQVAHLGGEATVACLELRVLALGSGELPVHLPGTQPAALTQPQRVLDEDEQRAEDNRERFHLARANASRPG